MYGNVSKQNSHLKLKDSKFNFLIDNKIIGTAAVVPPSQ